MPKDKDFQPGDMVTLTLRECTVLYVTDDSVCLSVGGLTDDDVWVPRSDVAIGET